MALEDYNAALAGLYDQDPKARYAAIKEAVRTGQHTAAASLLADPDPCVQAAAISALGLLGEWSSDYASTIKECMLKADDKEVKVAALIALGKMGAASTMSIESIARCLENQDPDVVAAACTAIGDLSAVSYSDKLVGLLKNSDSDVVVAAVGALGSLDTSSDDVGKLLSSKETKVKKAAVAALAKMSGVESYAKSAAALLGDSDAYVRLYACNFISALGEKASGEAATIGKLLSDKEAGVRACAASALAGIGAKADSQVEGLENLLTDEAEDKTTLLMTTAGMAPKVSPVLRKPACAAAAALAAVGSKGYSKAPAIAKGLMSKDSEIKIACAKAISEMGEAGAKCTDDLIKLADDPAPNVVAAACLALGTLAETTGSMSSAGEKVAECLNDKLPVVRTAAATSLAKMGDEATNYLDILVKKLQDPAWSVRAAAAKAVASCGELGQMYASDICRMLFDNEVAVQVAAIESLGMMGKRGSAFAEEIASMAEAPQAEIQTAAAKTLTSFGPKIAAQFGIAAIEG
mmetsp:Transcript_112172/g.194465  ORF Transcript_112172/g.194465 Transcript_112172/m.194465 type:complete len:522 (-) Transcript_112172:65-1630(-)